MRVFFVTFLGLVLYVGFLVATFFTDTNAGASTGEIAPLTVQTKVDSINVEIGKYSEQFRPPVVVGIGPGGRTIHIVELKTGAIRNISH